MKQFKTNEKCPLNDKCESGDYNGDKYCHYCLVDKNHICRFRYDVKL